MGIIGIISYTYETWEVAKNWYELEKGPLYLNDISENLLPPTLALKIYGNLRQLQTIY